MRNKRNAGFTLVEIMIVVAIIGLLAAIAVPSFMKARETSQKNACINNLRQLSGASDEWAIENNASTGDAVPDGALADFIKAYPPTCPASGTYTIPVVGTDPSCSLGATLDHALPVAGG